MQEKYWHHLEELARRGCCHRHPSSSSECDAGTSDVKQFHREFLMFVFLAMNLKSWYQINRVVLELPPCSLESASQEVLVAWGVIDSWN